MNLTKYWSFDATLVLHFYFIQKRYYTLNITLLDVIQCGMDLEPILVEVKDLLLNLMKILDKSKDTKKSYNFITKHSHEHRGRQLLAKPH